MMNRPNEMDVVRGFPKTHLRLFGHSLDCGVVTVDTEFQKSRTGGETRTLDRGRLRGEQDAGR